MRLYHYYDASSRPFLNLSDLPAEDAEAVLTSIRVNKPNTFVAKRQPSYVEDRRRYEEILRTEFLQKGGILKPNLTCERCLSHMATRTRHLVPDREPTIGRNTGGSFIPTTKLLSLSQNTACRRYGIPTANTARNGM